MSSHVALSLQLGSECVVRQPNKSCKVDHSEIFFFFFFFFFLQKWKRRLHSVQPQPTHPKITLACTACLSFNLMADQHSLLEIIRDLLTKKVMYQFECYCSTIWDNFNIGHKNNVLIIKSNFKFIYSLFCLYVFLIVFWWAKYRIIL